jgi:hypothetical protein
VPQYDNYCEIDPDTVDEFGIPVLRFHYNWTDYERNQAKHMHKTFEEIFDAMGAITLGDTPTAESEYGLAAPGRSFTKSGLHAWAITPATSVTNSYQQLHDC